MSWNGLFVVVRDAGVEDLARAGWRPSGPAVTADEASQLDVDGLAAVPFPTGVLLVNPSMGHVDVGRELARALGTEVVTALFGGTADVYEWRVDAPDRQRNWVRAVDEVPVDVGDPLPEEAGIDHLDEDSLWTLLTVRTGLPADWLEREAQPLEQDRAVAGHAGAPGDTGGPGQDARPDQDAPKGLLGRLRGRRR